MFRITTPIALLMLFLLAAANPVFSQSVKIESERAAAAKSSPDLNPRPAMTSEDNAENQEDIPSSVDIQKDAKVVDVRVKNGKAVISGTVTGSVYAVNSEVTLEKGAHVGGSLYMVDGTLKNLSGQKISAVKLTQEQFDKITAIAGNKTADAAATVNSDSDSMEAATTSMQAATSPEQADVQEQNQNISAGAWIGGQFAILIFGLLAALLMQNLANHTAQKAAETAVHEMERSAVMGAIFSGVILLSLAILHQLTHSWLGFAAAPLLTVLTIVTLVLLVCGWLCGLLSLSNRIAAVIGQANRGGIFLRIALLLSALVIFNIAVGSWFRFPGAVVLLAMGVLSVIGLGAIIANISDFRNSRFNSSKYSSGSGKFEWR